MLSIGIDDTDSKRGGCTTYIAALLADELSGVEEARLVRLNPNVPWKTRGNASVCLRVDCGIEDVKRKVLQIVEEYSFLEDEGTNPGVVFFEGEVPNKFKELYHQALHGIVSLDEAEGIAKEHGAELHKFKNGRGVIGALAAIGSDFGDSTYEIIAYRQRENWGKERRIDEESVFEMDASTAPLTFNNVDHVTKRILITPRSPCPVLFGIRGENKEVLESAFAMVRAEEPIERTRIFLTNQGTDAHLREVEMISEAKPYSSVILEGTVAREPKTILGGHVVSALSDGSESIDFAAYEPTKDFRKVVKALILGDRIRVYGGIRCNSTADEPMTINLEKVEVLRLAEVYREQNPVCEVCNRRMESAGREQGFRCRRCKTRSDKKDKVEVKRTLEEGLYSAPASAMRHLSKPLSRYTVNMPS
ncbi:MAG: tRNA(Ile)(2)-agmatinylcytidine synthase [Candidatus Hydrothermarchaeales archaeon]